MYRDEFIRDMLLHCLYYFRLELSHYTAVAPEGISKWGGSTGPERKWGSGTDGIFFWSCPSTFLALKVQLVVLVSAFVVVSTVWSVSCLLFFYSWCPRAQPFVKVGGGTCPPCPMESAPLLHRNRSPATLGRTNG